MGFWAWFFIFIVIVMAVGPIMLFKPSKRMQALDKLRSGAAAKGLQVRLADYTTHSQSQSVAVYSLITGKDHGQATLLRNEMEHDLHFFKHWDWQGSSALQLSSKQTNELKKFLTELPETIVGLEVAPNVVGAWWLEKQISRWGLEELEETLRKLNAVLS